MLYRSHQPTSVPTGRPSNRVGPAFRRLENRSRTYEKRRQHRSHRSWPTEREPMPPSEPLSFTLFPRSSPSFLPSLPLLLISSIPPLPPSFPYLCVPPYICIYIYIYLLSIRPLSPSLCLSAIIPLFLHPFSTRFRTLSIDVAPSVFRVASLSGCSRNNDARVPHSISDVGHTSDRVLPLFRRHPLLFASAPLSPYFSPPNPLPRPFLRAFSPPPRPPRARAVYSDALYHLVPDRTAPHRANSIPSRRSSDRDQIIAEILPTKAFRRDE